MTLASRTTVPAVGFTLLLGFFIFLKMAGGCFGTHPPRYYRNRAMILATPARMDATATKNSVVVLSFFIIFPYE